MKKAIIILLVAVVAMTAVFANTSDKEGFALRVSPAYLGNIGASYRMGDFEFEIDYVPYGPIVMLLAAVNYGTFTAENLIYLVTPVGGMAQVGYKIIATDMHELSTVVRFGYNAGLGGFTAGLGVEYDFCFNDHHAIYARVGFPVYPFVLAPNSFLILVDSNIGYRYTF